MDRLKETLRLRRRLLWFDGPPTEKWRTRWDLCTATFWLWLFEVRVRISLARYCAAIYRRELLEHKYEGARIKVGHWSEGRKEEQGS